MLFFIAINGKETKCFIMCMCMCVSVYNLLSINFIFHFAEFISRQDLSYFLRGVFDLKC